jgi:HAD superfamily hydrolase (TIGR01549 family)
MKDSGDDFYFDNVTDYVRRVMADIDRIEFDERLKREIRLTAQLIELGSELCKVKLHPQDSIKEAKALAAMIDDILAYCSEHHGMHANPEEVHETWHNAWSYAPLFDDVRPFIERCSLPVYVVTNDDLQYIDRSFADKGLKVAGVISAEMVRANKPHTEILEEALRMAGVEPHEAVLIGDSETSDVPCAQQVGITPILLDRAGKAQRTDIQVVRSLDELEF